MTVHKLIKITERSEPRTLEAIGGLKLMILENRHLILTYLDRLTTMVGILLEENKKTH